MSLEDKWSEWGWKARHEDGFYSFMSYSTRDDEIKTIKPFIDEYATELRSRTRYIPVFYDGFYIWNERHDLHHHLATNIRHSDFTTAFLSPGYNSSAWCGFEWGIAYQLSSERQRCRHCPRHSIFQILWKRFDDVHEYEMYRRFRLCDISREIESKDWSKAINKAVFGTLQFLDDLYGNRLF